MTGCNVHAAGADRDDNEHHCARIIALAFFRSWEKLPPHPANMLARVIPVLINRASDEPLVTGIVLPENQPPEPDTDRRKEFKALVRMVRILHRAKVRCMWWAPSEDYRPEQIYLRHTAELEWTAELRGESEAWLGRAGIPGEAVARFVAPVPNGGHRHQNHHE